MIKLVLVFIAGLIIGAIISQAVTAYFMREEFEGHEDNLYDFAKYCNKEEESE